MAPFFDLPDASLRFLIELSVVLSVDQSKVQ